MTTVLDIVTRAHRKIGVSGQGETLTAEMAADGLSAFNEMVSAWALDGGPAFSDVALTDTFPFPDRFREGAIHILAARISPEYELPPRFNEAEFYDKIRRTFMTIDEVDFNTAILDLHPHNYRFSR